MQPHIILCVCATQYHIPKNSYSSKDCLVYEINFVTWENLQNLVYSQYTSNIRAHYNLASQTLSRKSLASKTTGHSRVLLYALFYEICCVNCFDNKNRCNESTKVQNPRLIYGMASDSLTSQEQLYYSRPSPRVRVWLARLGK